MTAITPTIEMYLSGSWVDVTADVRTQQPIKVRRGLMGSAPTDRVAMPGLMQFSLDNSTANSGGLLGYYSPNNANLRTGFALGTLVRLKLVSGATTVYKFYGRIKKINPVSGKYGERYTEVVVADYMEQFAIHKVNLLAVQTSKRADQLATTVVGNLPIAPLNTSYATGPDTFTYSLNQTQDESTYANTVLQKVMQSGLDYFFVKGNGTDGETLTYESRQTRATRRTVSATLNDTMIGLDVDHTTDNIYNTVKATVFPINVDTSLVVLSAIPSEITLYPGATNAQVITMRYVDPTGAGTRVDILPGSETTPVANTDYKMSSVAGDGGNDVNANLAITVTWGGNSASVSIQNNGSTVAYVNKLQLRGKGLYNYNPQDATVTDATSKNTYGDHTLAINLPYQNNINTGKDFATHILSTAKDPMTNVQRVTFNGNYSSALAGYCLSIDIGDRVTVTETVTGLSSDFFVNAVEYSIMPGNFIQCSWLLEPASTIQYFILDTSTLGSTDQLGF